MRRASIALPVIAVFCLDGCKPEENANLAVADVVAYSPLTGSSPGAAYLSLHNRGDEPVELHRFASNCFERVELHRTAVEGGRTSMQRIDSIAIDARKSLHLRPGGLHLMMMQPVKPLGPGDVCTITIAYSGERQLSLPAELLDRSEYRPAEPVK